MNVGILGLSSMFLKLCFCIFNLIDFFPSFPLCPFLSCFLSVSSFLSLSFGDLLWNLSSSTIFWLIFSHLLFSPSVQYIILGIRFLMSKSSLLFSECLFLCYGSTLIIRTWKIIIYFLYCWFLLILIVPLYLQIFGDSDHLFIKGGLDCLLKLWGTCTIWRSLSTTSMFLFNLHEHKTVREKSGWTWSLISFW